MKVVLATALPLLSFMIIISSATESSFAQMEEPRVMSAKKGEDFSKWSNLVEQRQSQNYDEKRHQIETGVLLLRIGEIDRVVGSVELDFWFWAIIEQEDDPMNFEQEKPEFNFINARDIEYSNETVEPHLYEVQVKGTFFNEMEFNDFPFERLNMAIEVEPIRPYTSDLAYFVIDPDSHIDRTAKVPGWETGEYQITVEEYEYDETDIFPRFTAEFAVERSVLGSFVKYIFPVSMITGLSLLIFYIPENFTPRIYLTAPLLLSLIYLHQGALDDIPPVGYMTMFDKVMLINYSLFITAIGSLAIQMKSHVTHNDNDKVKRINNRMRYIIPVIISVGIIIIFTT